MAAQKLTNSAQEALQQAQAETIRRDHQELQPEHLLHALLEGGHNTEGEAGSALVSNILNIAGVNTKQLASQVDALLGKLPRVTGGKFMRLLSLTA
jgi:ATP-dependent Clp protease ATP-binding subunit ClpB